jgi:hypothetical protein
MHLEGPWLSTTSSKKRKNVKFKSAEHKAKYLASQKEWEALLKKHKINQEDKRKERAMSSKEVFKTTEPYRRETTHYPSLNSEHVCGVAAKAEPKVYTGTLIKGIATMHKSNAVPVFNNEQAEEIARMRR